jgi:hypothetical protein
MFLDWRIHILRMASVTFLMMYTLAAGSYPSKPGVALQPERW